MIRDPEEHTAFDEHGAVRSIQAADLTMPEAELDAIWTPMHLERLARTYWKYLSRVTLGLIRVAYTPTERAVVFIAPPVRAAALPRAGVLDGRRARRRALAHPRRHPRRLARATRATATSRSTCSRCAGGRRPAARRLHVEVEIASFYPAIAFRIARWVYANTQSRIHVLVTHGFLRSLAKLELEESAVGRFATGGARHACERRRRRPAAVGRRHGRRHAVGARRRARRRRRRPRSRCSCARCR